VTKQKLLSDPAIKAKNKAPGYYLDGHGLYLQVAAGGSRSWIFRYTLNKKTREMGLGSVDDFTLSEARERARQYRQIIADGRDPIAYRDAERLKHLEVQAETVRQNRTFRECANEYHRDNADDWKNAKHAAQWINTLTTYAFPKFGNLPVGQVSREHIREALLPIWKTKAETASRVLQRIRTVINYAAAMGYCAGLDSESWDQLKKALPKNSKQREVEHHASCPHSQVGALVRAVREGTSSEAVKLAFEFIVLTAARSGEVRFAAWEEIDPTNRCWIIPKERMKANRQHTVPLSDTAWTVLTEARQRRFHEDESATGLIFPNLQGSELSDMTFTQLLRRMGVDYTMHGFRASFRTWGADIAHHEHDMLEVALSHVVGDATVRAYHRSDMVEKRRRLMQEWADHLKATEDAELILSPTVLEAMERRKANRTAKQPT